MVSGVRHPTVRFADPYKLCRTCHTWIDGYVRTGGPGLEPLVPCGHRSAYRDVCPSWGPVDGCTCDEFNAQHPVYQDQIIHDRRVPESGDTRRY